MVELFVALFGGLFLFYKFFLEKKGVEKAEKVSNQREAICDELINKYTDTETQTWAKKYLLSGDNYDEICELFGEYFNFVFGSEWKNKLEIPNGYSVDVSTILYPHQHVYWVYHLLLANKGKIDRWCMTQGFGVGGIQDKETNIKFAQCIEKCMYKSGNQIDIVLELNRVTPKECYGGKLKLRQMCLYPTSKMW